MNKLFETIKNIWSIKELRERLLYTFGLMAVYRLGSFIALPGVNTDAIEEFLKSDKSGGLGLMDLINAFTGGAFSQVSIFALGIMPYISASIVVQLLGMFVPYIQKLQKEGESGRNKVNDMTRWLTIIICLFQGPSYLTYVTHMFPPNVFISTGPMFYVISSIILITGTVFAMWLGEKITDRGIGNGVSLLILVGIIAALPGSVIQEYTGNQALTFLVEIVIWLLILAAAIILTQGIRKVPIQYARRQAPSASKYVKGQTQLSGAREYLPLKVNAAGVMPIIFAQVIMFIPITVLGAFDSESIKNFMTTFSNPYGLWYNIVFAIMVIVFTFFYTAITVRTKDMADDMKRSGSFIPGIKPGMDTAEYIDTVLSRITIWGAIYLAILAIMPSIAYQFGVGSSFAHFFGGTSLLILVGVTIDTLQQINAYLLNKKYDGMMKSGRTTVSTKG